MKEEDKVKWQRYEGFGEKFGNLGENIFSGGLMAEASLQKLSSEWEWEEVDTPVLNGLFKNFGCKENDEERVIAV